MAASSPSSKTLAALLVTVMLWASAFVATRAVLVEGTLDPYRLALFRYAIASVALIVVARLFQVRVPRREDLPRLALSGLLGVGIYNSFLNLGQTQMKAGSAAFIVNTIPMFTAILSVLFLRDRLRPIGFVGMMISFAGIVLIAMGEGKELELNLGAAAILLAAVAWSIATILQKPLLRHYRAIEIVSYAIWSGTAFLLIFAPGLAAQITATSRGGLMLVVYLGVFPAAIAYVCWAFVLSQMQPSRAASFLYLIPPASVAIEIVWLGDVPGALSLVGGAFALGGVILTNTLGRPPAPIGAAVPARPSTVPPTGGGRQD